MSIEALQIPANSSEFKIKTLRLRVHSLSKINRRMKADVTARHEAKHALVAIDTGTPLVEASCLPTSDGASGHVITGGEFNPLVAAASFGTGEDGSSWDKFLVEQSGHSVSAAESGAKEVLSGKSDDLDFVGSVIQEEGVVTGGKLIHELNTFRHEKRNGKDFLVEVTTEEGLTKNIFLSGIKDGENLKVDTSDLLPQGM